jgi:hypothetical protein
MKGIYLTEEGKKAIEDKIAELENYTYATQNIWIEGQNSGMLKVLEEILSSAIILPVEENWVDIQNTVVSRKQLPFSFTEEYYPNGVIIKNK